jgi:hypothetical protein
MLETEDDFEKEVELMGQNEELISFLAERRRDTSKISLAEVKEELGLD